MCRQRRTWPGRPRGSRWNIYWAFAYNFLLIPLASGSLYPSLGILLPPKLAAGAMAPSLFSIVTLPLTLRRFKP